MPTTRVDPPPAPPPPPLLLPLLPHPLIANASTAINAVRHLLICDLPPLGHIAAWLPPATTPGPRYDFSGDSVDKQPPCAALINPALAGFPLRHLPSGW